MPKKSNKSIQEKTPTIAAKILDDSASAVPELGQDGNTKESSCPNIIKKELSGKFRKIFFTWNNYTNDQYEKIKNWADNNCTKCAIQPEVGESGTPHLQGAFEFKNPRSLSAITKMFPGIHLEKTRNDEKAIAYCQKEETKAGASFTKGVVKDPLQGKKPFKWQTKVLQIINEEPDDRKLWWFWCRKGCSGKTTLAKHICLKYKNKAIFLEGKSHDIKCGVAKFIENGGDLKVAIFGFPRQTEGSISYKALEVVKDGIFFSGKYESQMVMFNSPHVICFANFPPTLNESEGVSLDRWNVINIDEFKQQNKERKENKKMEREDKKGGTPPVVQPPFVPDEKMDNIQNDDVDFDINDCMKPESDMAKYFRECGLTPTFP